MAKTCEKVTTLCAYFKMKKILNVPSQNHVALSRASNFNIEIDLFSAKNWKHDLKVAVIAILAATPCDNVEVSHGEPE